MYRLHCKRVQDYSVSTTSIHCLLFWIDADAVGGFDLQNLKASYSELQDATLSLWMYILSQPSLFFFPGMLLSF